MSSRFWNNSDSDSSSEESSDSSVEEQVQKIAPKKKKAIIEDSESEEENRVVKTLKDKRFDELRDIIKKARNTRKNNDLNASLNLFQDFNKAFVKSQKVIEKEGTPRFYVRELYEIEKYVAAKWEDKEFKKKLSKDKSRSLTTLRQKLKKYLASEPKINAEFEEYKKAPDASDAETGDEEEDDKDSEDKDSEESLSSSEDEEVVTKPAKVASEKWNKAGSDDSDEWSSSDDDDDDSDDDSDSSISSVEAGEGEFARYTIEYFLKSSAKPTKKKPADKRKRKEPKQQKEKKEEDEEDTTWTTVDSSKKIGQQPTFKDGVPLIFARDVDVNAKNVVQKLAEIHTQRPRKESDRQNKVLYLKELRKLSAKNNLGLGLEMKIRLATISAIYEYNPKNKDYMDDDGFVDTINETREMVEILNKESNIILDDKVQDDDESLTDKVHEKTGKWHVRGSLANTCTKLDTEFIKLLQNSDQHSEEYRTRLRNNQSILEIFKLGVAWAEAKVKEFGEAKDEKEKNELNDLKQQICQMYILVVKYIYYRHKSQTPDMEDAEGVMERYCKYIYTNDETGRIRTQAILYNIYHLALHDKWFQARDLMLMSHLQESIHNADIVTQIIYNRTMVQLGLCAFRKGQMEDAHQALTDIQSGNRARELLAQGFSIPRERTQDQERTERRRMQPYHTHINTELLECVYLVSAMFLEIPYMAEKEFDHRRRMISKQFHYQLRNSEKQAFVGPPDNMREHVLAAAKALKVGDWKKCIQYLINPKMNQKVWNLFAETEKVKNMLIANAKKESLRVYLFSYSQFYDNISQEWIKENFEMDGDLVHSEVSKMIISEELKASWDEPTNSLVLHQTEPTRLQNLALQLSQRLNNLTEHNERLCESKQGSNFSAFYSSKSNSKGNVSNLNWSNRNQGGSGRRF